MKWSRDMEKLLIWMRGKNMPYWFCADIISRELKRNVTVNACIGRFHKLSKAP